MRILGHGIDIVEIDRIERMIQDHGPHFLERCFTPAELAYSLDQKHRGEHLAGRFAAKEAIFKALGTGWAKGIAWTDAEVVRESTGRPVVALHGRCREIAAGMGIDAWWLSISHTKGHAIASAIAVDSRT